MIPILFSPESSAFSNNGIGFLTDTISCLVTEERNGSYELEMRYPVDGQWASNIGIRSLIKAKPHPANKYEKLYLTNPDNNFEMFRVYNISKPLSGVVTIKARHISYDLSGAPCRKFSVQNTDVRTIGIMIAFNALCYNDRFLFATESSYASLTTSDFTVPHVTPVRSLVLGDSLSMISKFGGEVLWLTDYSSNTFRICLQSARGEQNKAVIRYGKNLVDIQQDLTSTKLVSGFVGYYYKEDDGTYVDSGIVSISGANFVNVQCLDLTSNFDSTPSQAELISAVNSYISSGGYGAATESLTVKFADLSKYTDYDGLSYLESVNLCDSVIVIYDKLNIATTLKCISYTYDTLLEQYESINLGTKTRDIIDTIFDMGKVKK